MKLFDLQEESLCFAYLEVNIKDIIKEYSQRVYLQSVYHLSMNTQNSNHAFRTQYKNQACLAYEFHFKH